MPPNRHISFPHVAVSDACDILVLQGPDIPVLFVSSDRLSTLFESPELVSAVVITDLAATAIITLITGRAKFDATVATRSPVHVLSLTLRFRTPSGFVVVYVSDERLATDATFRATAPVHLVVTDERILWPKSLARSATIRRADQHSGPLTITGLDLFDPPRLVALAIRQRRPTTNNFTTTNMNEQFTFTDLIDDAQFWRLNDPPRWPVTEQEWDIAGWLPEKFTRDVPLSDVLDRLISADTAVLAAASVLFTPTQWRLLYYGDQYRVTHCALAMIDPKAAFQRIWTEGVFIEDVPCSWTGADRLHAEVIAELKITVANACPDVLAACWCILAVARCIQLEKSDVLRVPWFEAWWLRRFSAACR